MTKREGNISYLGEGLHTTLRKSCDSTPTTVLWNLLQVMPDEYWAAFVTNVYDQMKKDGVTDRPTEAQLLKAITVELYLMEDQDRWPKLANRLYWERLFRCTIKLFSPEDRLAWVSWANHYTVKED